MEIQLDIVNSLPERLGKKPLIDAVFECRFQADNPMSSVLPGILVSRLNGTASINNLPAMELPPAVRNADPNLHFAPLVGIEWDNFNISVGDRNIIVGCKMPYQGWCKFKDAILEVLGVISGHPIINTVQRYSLKYVDLIPSLSFKEQAALLDLNLSIGGIDHSEDRFTIRLDFNLHGYNHILNIIAGASAQLGNGEIREGLVIDTDTLHNTASENFTDWVAKVEPDLDSLHTANKSVFFGCLSKKGLDQLEPQYAI